MLKLILDGSGFVKIDEVIKIVGWAFMLAVLGIPMAFTIFKLGVSVLMLSAVHNVVKHLFGDSLFQFATGVASQGMDYLNKVSNPPSDPVVIDVVRRLDTKIKVPEGQRIGVQDAAMCMAEVLRLTTANGVCLGLGKKPSLCSRVIGFANGLGYE